MRFRRPLKKPGQPRAPAGSAPQLESPGVASAVGNRALERDLKGAGQPLPGATRTQMESALGGNFKDVRVHTGPEAARLAQAEGATAFAEGKDVVFDRDQYRPGTAGGDALIAHELAHVVQQRGATRRGPQSAALEADANKAATRSLSGLFGGMRMRLAGAGPALRSGLNVQRCSCGANKMPAKGPGKTAATKGAGKAEAKAEAGAPDPLAPQKAALAKTYGFSRVANGDAEWSPAELAKLARILAKIPPDAKAAIQGVALMRVKTPNCPGADPAGCFRAIVNDKTGEREDVIEIGDEAFTSDQDLEDKTSDVKVTRRDASGAKIETLPSEETVAHEVGHALESAVRRRAEAARFKSDLAVTAKQEALNKAAQAFRNPAIAGISNATPLELAYHAALVHVNQALEPVAGALDQMGDPDSRKVAAMLAAVKKQKPIAQKAIAARDAAKKKLPAGSSAPQPDAEAGQDAALAAIDDIVKALEERLAATKELEKGQAEEAASKAKVPGSKAPVETSRRLAEMVAIIDIRKVDVKKSGAIRDYPKENWPDRPGELYADLFEMSLAEPGGLKLFSPDLADYFRQPIGVKDPKLKKQVDEWVKKHNK